jgi:hypothetical protein
MSVDEMYDELVHAEFLAGAVNTPPRRGAHAAIKATMSSSRLRSIALVTSGGLAFAAIGAFLGGLGGEFAVTPAGAHALTTTQKNMALSAAPAAAFSAAAAQSAALHGLGPATATAGNDRGAGGSASAPFTPSSTGTSTTAAPVSSTSSTSTGGSSTGGSGTSGSGTGGSSSGGSGGTTTGSTPPAPTSPVTQIVGQAGLSGVTTDLTQTLSGVVGSVSAPGTGLSTVTNPLTGVVNGVTSGLLGG